MRVSIYDPLDILCSLTYKTKTEESLPSREMPSPPEQTAVAFLRRNRSGHTPIKEPHFDDLRLNMYLQGCQ